MGFIMIIISIITRTWNPFEIIDITEKKIELNKKTPENNFILICKSDVLGYVYLPRLKFLLYEDNNNNPTGNVFDALLSFNSHSLIHYLEINYNKEYNYLNSLFLELNRSKKEPSKEYYELVSSVLKRVKKDIKNKRRGRKW